MWKYNNSLMYLFCKLRLRSRVLSPKLCLSLINTNIYFLQMHSHILKTNHILYFPKFLQIKLMKKKTENSLWES